MSLIYAYILYMYMACGILKLTSISRIITLLPFVYKKFFPLGSPFKGVGFPLTVLGEEANTCPVNMNKAHSNDTF